MTNLAAIAAACLVSHGVPTAVADTLRFEATDAGQGVITVGFDRKGRRSVTAQLLAPTVQDAVAVLADRERVAGLLAQGVRAIPAASRPEVPAWIADSVAAKRANDLRRRATAAATRACDTADLPWAA